MIIISEDKLTKLSLDESGTVTSFRYRGTELVSGSVPLFRISLRDSAGRQTVIKATEAGTVRTHKNTLTYSNFSCFQSLSVTVSVFASSDGFKWSLNAAGMAGLTTEWVDFPLVSFKPIKPNLASILYPYNEGTIVDDISVREKSWFGSCEPCYPSKGSYSVFPNMVFAQFMAYLRKENGREFGIYFGAHDRERGVKYLDFFRNPDSDSLIILLRTYSGLDENTAFSTDFDIVWKPFEGSWEDAASIYRNWFENNLPPKAVKIRDNTGLPEWYEDSPLVVTYPVRGIHDMDEMKPNKLFPYAAALPLIDEIASKVGSRLLVLLMHWEGTAPWAPPYVWPPYGGTDAFSEFRDELHRRNHLMGVYCSGFGYTVTSNLIPEYTCEEVPDAFCAGPDGKVELSNICTAQRKGYDLCPACGEARNILNNAYKPLFGSGIDYVQILDQNHGGGQYFCYSKNHGHPCSPGKWMTENMQIFLSGWNDSGKNQLFGCESAAAEPFIGNLLFSDCRYELNWQLGTPVPLYSFIYHEYIRNFMGNQVCNPFPASEDTLAYRIAYSFAAGDAATVVLTPDGLISDSWGTRDFTNHPDKDLILEFLGNLNTFYKNKAKKYLYNGRMVKKYPVRSVVICYDCFGREIMVPAVLSSAWEAEDGKTAQIFVNPGVHEVKCSVSTDKGPIDISVGPLSARLEII